MFEPGRPKRRERSVFDKAMRKAILALVAAATAALVSISMGKKVCLEFARKEETERPGSIMANPGVALPQTTKEENK